MCTNVPTFVTDFKNNYKIEILLGGLFLKFSDCVDSVLRIVNMKIRTDTGEQKNFLFGSVAYPIPECDVKFRIGSRNFKNYNPDLYISNHYSDPDPRPKAKKSHT